MRMPRPVSPGSGCRRGRQSGASPCFCHPTLGPQRLKAGSSTALGVTSRGQSASRRGCYPISLSRFIFNAEPSRVVGIVERDPNFKTDRIASAVLDFGSGTSSFTCSTQLAPYQRVQIVGDQGRVEIEIPFNAPNDRPCKLWHQVESGEINEMQFDICDQYGIQGDLFSQAIRNDTPVPTPIADAVGNMKVIEAIVRSADSGQWETL